MKHYTIMIKLIGLFTLLLGFQAIQAQSWDVPEDKNQKVSPLKFTEDTKKKGEVVFQKNCISCHGTPGKNDFVKNIIPPPGDPATEQFQKQTDGALFFKITTGRAPMPSFKDILTDEERWQVISYFRGFNPKYTQPEPILAPTGAYGGMTISLKMNYLPNEKKIKVIASGTKENKTTLLSGIDLAIYAKRYFGNLQIDESKTTNVIGEAFFDYTDSIPGDSIGNINFVVKVNTEGLNGYKQDTLIKAGKIVKAKSLIDTRAMWTISSKAPIWLILAYSLVVIGVWSFLIFIALQIKKIRSLGEKNNTELQ
jgi:mono/diheme cytochrome c family protein